MLCEMPYKHFSKDHICVSSTEGQAPSKGDSGGPLVMPTTSIFGPVLIGICTSSYPRFPHYPALYLRVSSYLHWIKDNTEIAYY